MSALATVPRETLEAGQRLEELPLSSIDVGENVRVDAGEMDELVASIAELGVLQPVRAIGPNAAGRYRLVWGQRRYLACSQLGLVTIPALVEASAEADKPGARRSIEQLAENLQRKDLNPMEEAVALRQVLDGTKGLTQDALAKQISMSAPWVANTLGLLRAPKKVQELVRTEEITAAHAKAVSGLPDDVQVRLAKSAVERWGVAKRGQQYAGFALLTAGPGQEDLGRQLVEQYGGITEALRATHPDTGKAGHTVRDFAAVQAYRKQLGVSA